MKAKMKSKMDEKWMKKANCEQPYSLDQPKFWAMIHSHNEFLLSLLPYPYLLSLWSLHLAE